jgi:protein-L-isoaspartate(D-aspartate) O-methyltransferase
LLTAVPLGCLSKEPPVGKREAARTSAESRQRRADSDDRYTDLRHRMVREQIEGRDVSEPRVLEAMRRVARHRFVPEGARDAAYDDHPLPIGHGQTISQPYIVALMTQLARPKPEDRALDVGTGSGYQAAVLAELVERVYSIEIVCPLADEADKRLQGLGYENVEVRCGDGYQGWPEHAPFDVIIVAAAPDHVPEPLVEQLAVGGRMVIPVGSGFDMELLLIEKIDDGTTRRRTIAPVLFVPMTGQAQDPRTARER